MILRFSFEFVNIKIMYLTKSLNAITLQCERFDAGKFFLGEKMTINQPAYFSLFLKIFDTRKAVLI